MLKGLGQGAAVLVSQMIEYVVNIKHAFFYAFLIAFASGVPLLFLSPSDPSIKILIAICVFSASFGIMIGFKLVYYLNPLIFPANFVANSMGTSNFMA